KVFQGAILVGDGFLLSPSEASLLINQDTRNQDVIFPSPRGREDVNNSPDQSPGRWAINFCNLDEARAKTYSLPFQIVEERVKPERLTLDTVTQVNRRRRDFWWQWGSPATTLYQSIQCLDRCFVISAPAKYLAYSMFPAKCAFTNTLYVFTTDRWD